MAVATVGPGRPRLVADFNLEEDPDLPLWEEFHKVCRGFSCGEIRAVSRGLGVHVNTVERWKYGLNFPSRRGIMVLVILWAKNGKPMRKVSPSQSPVST